MYGTGIGSQVNVEKDVLHYTGSYCPSAEGSVGKSKGIQLCHLLSEYHKVLSGVS